MSLLSAQIVNGTNIILPWSITGGFSESCTVGEFYDDLKSGKLNLSFFTFPEKLSNSTCTTEVGRSKNDSFDRSHAVQTVTYFIAGKNFFTET